jgi:hypothetical protein
MPAYHLTCPVFGYSTRLIGLSQLLFLSFLRRGSGGARRVCSRLCEAGAYAAVVAPGLPPGATRGIAPASQSRLQKPPTLFPLTFAAVVRREFDGREKGERVAGMLRATQNVMSTTRGRRTHAPPSSRSGSGRSAAHRQSDRPTATATTGRRTNATALDRSARATSPFEREVEGAGGPAPGAVRPGEPVRDALRVQAVRRRPDRRERVQGGGEGDGRERHQRAPHRRPPRPGRAVGHRNPCCCC